MSERAYTVKEIDALRGACRNRVIWGTTRPRGGRVVSRVFSAGEVEAQTERLIRTYMLAGITAEDIYKQDAE